MHSPSVSALLTDPAGNILLVRRQSSLLWNLPGGIVRQPVPLPEFLTSLCRRQIGMAPDFVAPLELLHFAGTTICIGRDEIPHDRPRACGQVTSTAWFDANALPQDLVPIARLIIVRHHMSHAATAVAAIRAVA